MSARFFFSFDYNKKYDIINTDKVIDFSQFSKIFHLIDLGSTLTLPLNSPNIWYDLE